MSEVGTAMLTLGAVTFAYLAIVFFVWRARRGPSVPFSLSSLSSFRLPRWPTRSSGSRSAGEKPPRLPRRTPALDAPAEISAARLARISGKAAPAPETVAAPPPEPAAPQPSPGPAFTPVAPAFAADTLVAEHDAPAAPPRSTAPDEGGRATIGAMLDAMATGVVREADRIEARGSGTVAVRLVAQIPPRTDEARTSWLGGRPRLDPGARWPEIREVPGDFLGQIACADLPRDLWDGLGPRQGSLAFFIHPRDGDIAVVPVAEDGEPMDPPHPPDAGGSFFAPAGGLRFGDLMPFTRHAFPEWPVDLVAVGPEAPGAADDAPGDDDDPAHRLHRAGYDIADPAFHPFDWALMRAMVDILAMRIERFWREVDGPSPIDTQRASVERRLAQHDAGTRDPLGREGLVAMRDTLDALHAATDAARAANREARARAEEIVAIVRDSAGRLSFSASDAAAVMEALRAIRWTKVNRKPDPEGRPGAELVERLTLPLTEHHPDAPLWVHDYLAIWFDHAKHAYAADPAALPAAARARFEPWARELAAREMPGIGHVPRRYVRDYDADSHATLLELPSSGLMSWSFGDTDPLVLTMRKADLAAGRWDRPLVQFGS